MNDFVIEQSCQQQVKLAGMSERLKKRGIVPVSHSGASIGWNEEEKKWYGWSHRAIYGFGVGSSVKKGDCGFGARGAWTAKTLDQARQMAVEFSKSVS